MPYLQTIIDYFEDQDFVIPEDNSAETLYEQLEGDWKPNNRFPIWKILGDDLPDFIIWLQNEIDDTLPDDTPVFIKEDKEIDDVKRYIERELILEPEKSIDSEFEDISRILKGDNRPALDKVFRRNKKEFLDFLRSSVSEPRDEPKADPSLEPLERTIETLERSIDDVLQRINVNMLGTPIRVIEEIPIQVESNLRRFIRWLGF